MSAKCFCEWCGKPAGSVADLVRDKCPKSPYPNGYHKLYQGSIKVQYVCQYCGMKYGSISLMVNNKCSRNPIHRGHSPAL